MKLRIVVVTPPRGVTFALQRGRTELLPPASASPDGLAFDFEVRRGTPPTRRLSGRRLGAPIHATLVSGRRGRRPLSR